MRDEDCQRIDPRINSEFDDLSRQRRDRIEVRKRRRRRRIGVVIAGT